MKRKAESGFVAIELVFGLAVLLVPITVLVTVLPTWSERKEMAVVAAREAARTYAVTHDAVAAQQVVDEISNNYKLKDDTLTLELRGDPTEAGGTVTAVTSVRVPLTVIPVLEANADAFSFTQSHTEYIDRYRSLP